MAPRGRPVKRGERRIDAALDAMALYGFPNKLVRQTLAQLLKVYGGNDGWVFIEDSAYTLLIDTLLEQQQQQQQQTIVDPLPQPQDCLIEDNPGNGPDEASPVGCSNRALLPCSNTEASDNDPSTNQVVDTILAANETGNQPPIMAMDTTSPTSKTVNEIPINPIDTLAATSKPSNQPSIKAVETVSPTGENDNRVPIKAINNVSAANNKSEPPQTKSSQPMRRLCHKRRKPCHGWIASDDDDDKEEELIELPPGSLYNALLMNSGVN